MGGYALMWIEAQNSRDRVKTVFRIILNGFRNGEITGVFRQFKSTFNLNLITVTDAKGLLQRRKDQSLRLTDG